MSTNFPSHSRSCIPILYRAQPQTRRGAQAVLMANPRHEAVKNDLLEAVKSRESGAYLDEIDSFLKQKKKYCADDVNLAHQILDVCLVSDIFEKELDDVNGRLKEKYTLSNEGAELRVKTKKKTTVKKGKAKRYKKVPADKE